MDGTNVAREGSAASTHPLAYVRRRHGWSYQDVARVIAEHARALGVPMAARREKVWRWEHWGVVPEADSQRALARALGIPAREVDARPWPRWLPAHGGMPDGLPWTTEGSLTALASVLDDTPAGPCGVPIADEPALLDAIADWDAAGAEDARHRGAAAAEHPPVQAAAAAEHSVVDGSALDWLEAGVTGLRQLDDRLGGAAVRHRVEADLRLVNGLLRRGLPGRAGRWAERRLLRVAADLAQLGGWAATDCGRHGAAQRHCLTGLRLAHSAGDRPLAVALWGALALQSVIADRPRDAVAAAEAAVRAAGGGPPSVRALAASRLARAHAAAGAEGACRRAEAEAERQLDAAGTDPGPPWLYWLGTAELTAQHGLCLLALGRAAEAAPLLDRALERLEPSFVRDRSLYSARAAEAHARTGDRDRAMELGREAARLSRHCGSPRLAAALDTLKGCLDEDGRQSRTVIT
ncbi:tetratricopeptide repeat protein [Streptomyces sp. IBSBF 2435]|uniref:tetratricopeptide repeat protein n=1 Tax=Streptomyces sp. IBSBF 2435 TaxID=2903531 RepID=UPI002FDC2D59